MTRFPFALVWAALAAGPGFSQARPDMLVTPEWLARKLSNPSIVILHVGSESDYRAGHVPEARLVALSDISITGEQGLRLELPPADRLQEAFGKLGIGDDSRIVVYAGTDSVQSATRVWFTLDYLGWGNRASLLDGGLRLWRAQGRPLSTETPSVKPQTNTARPRPEVVVDSGWLQLHLSAPEVTVLDARTPEFYTGASAGSMPRAGHIPGARNVPFSSLLDEGRLKPEPALRSLMGAPRGTVVSYCHIGQQATVLYFVARYLGFEARLYDGSFQDWSTRQELRVETGR